MSYWHWKCFKKAACDDFTSTILWCWRFV